MPSPRVSPPAPRAAAAAPLLAGCRIRRSGCFGFGPTRISNRCRCFCLSSPSRCRFLFRFRARRFATGLPCRARKRSRPFGRVSLAPPSASRTARSACPAVRSAHRRLPGRRRRATRRRPGSAATAIGARVASLALAGCAGFGLRLGSPALAFAIAALRAPRRGPAAHAPRRLSSGSDSGTGLPDVRYPRSGPSYALRRLGSHTPRSGLLVRHRRPAGTPELPFNAPHPP